MLTVLFTLLSSPSAPPVPFSGQSQCFFLDFPKSRSQTIPRSSFQLSCLLYEDASGQPSAGTCTPPLDFSRTPAVNNALEYLYL